MAPASATVQTDKLIHNANSTLDVTQCFVGRVCTPPRMTSDGAVPHDVELAVQRMMRNHVFVLKMMP